MCWKSLRSTLVDETVGTLENLYSHVVVSQESVSINFSKIMKLQVFGSAGVIGNPVGFARSLGLGIKDFFSLPIWSVIQVTALTLYRFPPKEEEQSLS